MFEVLEDDCNEKEDDGGGGEIHDLDDEELVEEDSGARVWQRKSNPNPSAREIREHSVTHIPYRSWCNVCVAARGVATGHRQKRDGDEQRGPSVSFDYCFLRNRPSDPSICVLVGRDRESKTLIAHTVPAKGAEVEWAAAQVVKDLRKLGHHSNLILKSDQEPAIVSFLQDVANRRTNCVTLLEHSPVGDSQANGLAERAVRALEEMVRVVKLDLEKRIGSELNVDESVIDWVVEHAADIVTKCQKGSDGRTAYQRLKGKVYKGELYPIATPVMFRVSGKVQGGVLRERWVEGLWLGKRFSSDEHIVSRLSDGKVFRSRSVQALGREASGEEVRAIIGRPWAPTGTLTSAGEDIPRPSLPREVPVEPAGFQARSVYITKDVLAKFGFTKQCHKCRILARGDEGKGVPHSKECREIIEEKMNNDPVLRERLVNAEEKKVRCLAEEVERNVKLKTQEVLGAPATLKRKAEGEASQADVADDLEVPLADDVEMEMPSNAPGCSTSSGSGATVVGAASMPIPLASGEAVCASSGLSRGSTGPGGEKRKIDDVGGEQMEDEEEGPPSRRVRAALAIAHLHDVEWAEMQEEVEAVRDTYDGSSFEWMEASGGADLHGVSPQLIADAKAEELKRFRSMEVYAKVPQSEMERDEGYVHVGTRWVVTNKGSIESPKVKARLVAQEFATSEGKGELFAGTPGLGPLRSIVSNLATNNPHGERRLMVMDVKSAFLYGRARRRVYVQLPHEDQQGDVAPMVGRLNKAMYGTRDAPPIWHEHLCQTLVDVGFMACKLNPGVYVHKERGLELAVHVDDLAATGALPNLEWLYGSLSKAYEVKKELLGPGHSLCVQYLGRTLQWTSEGIEWVHDEKHSRVLIQEYGMENCKTTCTPVTHEDYSNESGNDERPLMEPLDARKFRACAARLNYLAQDRPDLVVASCLVARSMAAPRVGDEVKLKRAIRYLKLHPVVSIQYQWQPETSNITLMTDSDWASCKATRRSCSGGVVMRGSHLLAFWCKLQHKIALSSGEAELYSSNKGLSEYLGTLHLMREMIDERWGVLKHQVDASACRSMLLRKGAGSLKHLEIRDLWGQEVVKRLGIVVEKIGRDSNASDALASPCTWRDLRRHMHRLGVQLDTEDDSLASVGVSRGGVPAHHLAAHIGALDSKVSCSTLSDLRVEHWSPTSGCSGHWSRGGVNVQVAYPLCRQDSLHRHLA